MKVRKLNNLVTDDNVFFMEGDTYQFINAKVKKGEGLCFV